MFPCRLIIDPPASGAWNMAVDEALLNQAADAGLATLRFYQWSPPTLSLGYFQHVAKRDEHASSGGAPVVRRLSGGGALMHDRELTYSACLPAAHPLSRQSTSLYGLVHRALICVLADHGVAARLSADSSTGSAASALGSEGDQFLCFLRRSAEDVVAATATEPAAWAKIAGSAQRRRRGAVLQHGSLLLAASPLAPELAGVREVSGVSLDPGKLAEAWAASLAGTLKLSLNRIDGPEASPSAPLESLVQKYRSSQWTARR